MCRGRRISGMCRDRPNNPSSLTKVHIVKVIRLQTTSRSVSTIEREIETKIGDRLPSVFIERRNLHGRVVQRIFFTKHAFDSISFFILSIV